jgi:hypothetical protein
MTKEITKSTISMSLPTPWNNLEAGILYRLKLLLLVFKEAGIDGGIFNIGTTDVFVQRMPSVKLPKEKNNRGERCGIKTRFPQL